MYYRANMETIRLSIACCRTIVDANFVHRVHVNWRPGLLFQPRAHFLYYQLAGDRNMEDWEGRFDMNPGDVILFYGGRAYASFPPASGYRAMNILFAPVPDDRWQPGRPAGPADGAGDACANELSLASRVLTGGDPAIRERFAEVVQLTHSPIPLRRRKAEALLQDLLIELALRSQAPAGRWSAPIEYAIGFIDKNLDRKLRIDELADLVDLSRRSLTRRFRRATGRSIHEYHQAKRIALAVSLLKTHPDITLREVADTLGFYDEFHLSRAFRQHVGVSPAAFRRREHAPEE